jgi:hypothetical protein
MDEVYIPTKGNCQLTGGEGFPLVAARCGSTDLAAWQVGWLRGVLADNAETHCLVVKMSLHGLVHADRDQVGTPAVDDLRDVAIVVARYLHAVRPWMPRWRIFLRADRLSRHVMQPATGSAVRQP